MSVVCVFLGASVKRGWSRGSDFQKECWLAYWGTKALAAVRRWFGRREKDTLLGMGITDWG